MPMETKATGQIEKLHGLMAEFDEPEQLLAAANKAREEGYREMDAYAPMPVEGLAEAVGFHSTMVQRIVFIAGLCGATGGFMLCWWITVIAYPHNRGGQAAQQLARVYTDHVRIDGAGCMYHRGGRDAGAERAAAAVSSGVQREGIRARLARQIFPVHRSERSEIRFQRHLGISRRQHPRQVMEVET